MERAICPPISQLDAQLDTVGTVWSNEQLQQLFSLLVYTWEYEYCVNIYLKSKTHPKTAKMWQAVRPSVWYLPWMCSHICNKIITEF